MNNSIFIILGMPEHGWLPVDFRYGNFDLPFYASDVLNNPIEELYNAVVKLQNDEQRQVIWWLEPAAYFFDFERKREEFTLIISQTQDLHRTYAENNSLITIAGTRKQIIDPFRLALKQFASQTYDEKHWPYNLDKGLISNLK